MLVSRVSRTTFSGMADYVSCDMLALEGEQGGKEEGNIDHIKGGRYLISPPRAGVIVEAIAGTYRGVIHGDMMATYSTTAVRSNSPMERSPQRLVVVSRRLAMSIFNNGKVSILLQLK